MLKDLKTYHVKKVVYVWSLVHEKLHWLLASLNTDLGKVSTVNSNLTLMSARFHFRRNSTIQGYGEVMITPALWGMQLSAVCEGDNKVR